MAPNNWSEFVDLLVGISRAKGEGNGCRYRLSLGGRFRSVNRGLWNAIVNG